MFQYGREVPSYVVRASSQGSRESLLRALVTETLGKLSTLYEEQHIVGRRLSSECFHFAHAVQAEGIEADTVLYGYHVLHSLGVEEDEFFLVRNHSNRDFRPGCYSTYLYCASRRAKLARVHVLVGIIDAQSHSCSAALKHACDPAYRTRYSTLVDR